MPKIRHWQLKMCCSENQPANRSRDKQPTYQAHFEHALGAPLRRGEKHQLDHARDNGSRHHHHNHPHVALCVGLEYLHLLP